MADTNGISSDEKRLRRSYFKTENLPSSAQHFPRRKLFKRTRRIFHAGRAAWSNMR